MRDKKYSVILGNLGNTCDRFLSSGYKEPLDKDVMLSQASSIEGVTGIELVGTWDVNEENCGEMKKKLHEHKLECVSIIPDIFSRKKWGRGSLCAADAKTRKDAEEEIKKTVDIAVELNCPLLNIWPGQDGYDYPLCADYIEERGWFIEGIKECAGYARDKDVRLALEYKVKEPRTHSYLARVSDTLLAVKEVNMDNVGVCIDTGHSFAAYENTGESIGMLKMFGDKLFHMHFNDNYTHWDDDMIVGSVHLVEYVEILFWLEKTGYGGWYSMDQYPYREDGYGAIRSSILFIRKLRAAMQKAGIARIEELIKLRDPVETSAFIREHLIK